jgi:hypothetical protein
MKYFSFLNLSVANHSSSEFRHNLSSARPASARADARLCAADKPCANVHTSAGAHRELCAVIQTRADDAPLTQRTTRSSCSTHCCTRFADSACALRTRAKRVQRGMLVLQISHLHYGGAARGVGGDGRTLCTVQSVSRLGANRRTVRTLLRWRWVSGHLVLDFVLSAAWHSATGCGSTVARIMTAD